MVNQLLFTLTQLRKNLFSILILVLKCYLLEQYLVTFDVLFV